MVVLKETTELIPRPALNCMTHLKQAVFFLPFKCHTNGKNE